MIVAATDNDNTTIIKQELIGIQPGQSWKPEAQRHTNIRIPYHIWKKSE